MPSRFVAGVQSQAFGARSMRHVGGAAILHRRYNGPATAPHSAPHTHSERLITQKLRMSFDTRTLRAAPSLRSTPGCLTISRGPSGSNPVHRKGRPRPIHPLLARVSRRLRFGSLRAPRLPNARAESAGVSRDTPRSRRITTSSGDSMRRASGCPRRSRSPSPTPPAGRW